MARMLLVLNGAQYSLEAVKKAVEVARVLNDVFVRTDKVQMDILYVNPSCYQLYPDLPEVCFWMPPQEYNSVLDRIRKRVLDEEILPIFEEAGIRPKILITSEDQDEKIKQVSSEGRYEKIFIASPSKYCGQKTRSWLRTGHDMGEIPGGIVCLHNL